MKRHITPRSLFNDIVNGKTECEDDLRSPIAKMLLQFASVQLDDKTKWKNLPIVSVLETIVEVIEKLLWDSGHLTEEETEGRQRIYTQIVAIKKEVQRTIDGTKYG